ncbi:MAG: TIGR01777 family oxidoreductase [Bacteroidota bacterium]|nr:TIGR01777 family oxidoreductase [Bacteroidota bacterium]MDX5429493.1 TIGR01777 family oxidoreductase [Bacteroidota bacterium]MDX5468278.1 TIGR01777 family oxidoreductase [Bacteroidota bacterium]
MHIVIAGGSGSVGKALRNHFENKGNQVFALSRNAKNPIHRWDPEKGVINPEALQEADVVINLAGANMAGGLWTKKYKKLLYDSRIDSTKLLVETLAKLSQKKRHFIQASAVGYYANSPEWMTEEHPPGNDFLAQLARDWEVEGCKVKSESTLLSIVRLGVVLQRGQGFLSKTVPPARFGLATAFGKGNQWMSWVHIDDVCRSIDWIIENQAEGAFNVVADEPSTNKALTAAIAKAVKRPFFLPNVPGFLLKWLLGDFSAELLADHRASNKKLQTMGFQFRFKHIESALNDLLNE